MKLFALYVTATFFVVTNAEFVDLTYGLNKDTIVWPGRSIKFNTEFEGELPDGGW